MQQISLSGDWTFRQADSPDWMPCTVPGSVHTDLQLLDLIPNPFLGMHELDVQWVPEKDWEYRRDFRVTPEMLEETRIDLVCEGLDTLAEIHLNGELVGRTENQFRQYRWSVKSMLRAGANQIVIRFASPINYIDSKMASRPLPGTQDGIAGGQYLRKSPYHFGWDWGPRLPVIGIWKEIYLETASQARLGEVSIRQNHSTLGPVELSLSAEIERWLDEPLQVEFILQSPGEESWQIRAEVEEVSAAGKLTIPQPQLWWPNGLGPQPLYTVRVHLHAGETLLDSREFQVGLRTVELRRLPDDWGQSFLFVVNNVPVFCKGSNWIPPDSFPTRVTPQRLEFMVASAASANMNMLRVWGGGYYESDAFYALCDRYGIMIWQDFMFSCRVYPFHEPEYVENVRQEVQENVRRIRHHACLALWCGNNELDLGWAEWEWEPAGADLMDASRQIFRSELPGWVQAEDPDTPYWYSSPASESPEEDPNSDRSGDAHLWNIWHEMEPIAEYHSRIPRFVSEFGMQSIPPAATLAEFAEPSLWKMSSEVMLHHQRSQDGNSKLAIYLLYNLRLAKTFEDLVYTTQILQLETLRTGVEHWRRQWPRTTGALYWQLNDCWPGISWSTIDYFGRWKAAHYAARRVFAPVLLSIEDEGTTASIWLTGELTSASSWTVRWSLEDVDGTALASGEEAADLEPLSSMPVRTVEFGSSVPEAEKSRVVLIAELWRGGELISWQVMPFVTNRDLELTDPGLDVQVFTTLNELHVCVTSQALARYVEVSVEGVDLFFTDNYFDLPAGRSLTVTAHLPEGWTLEKARQNLQVRSLYHSYTIAPQR